MTAKQILEKLDSLMEVVTKDAIKSSILEYAGRSNGLWMHPVSMNSENANLLRNESYMVSPKADGIRQLLILKSELPGLFLLGRDQKLRRLRAVNTVWMMPASADEHRDMQRRAQFYCGAVLDGEVVIEETTQQLLFLTHDALVLKDIQIEHLSFQQRWHHVLQLLTEFPSSSCSTTRGFDFCVYAKKMYSLNGFEQLCTSVENGDWKSVRVDGYMFIPTNHAYIRRTCDSMLKWKQKTDNTVDATVLLKKTGENKFFMQLLFKENAATYTVMYTTTLEITDKNQRAEFKRLNGSICEFRIDADTGIWTYIKKRKDKLEPNSVYVCRNILYSIRNFISLEDLKKIVGNISSMPSNQQLYKDSDSRFCGIGMNGSTVTRPHPRWRKRSRNSFSNERRNSFHWKM